MLSSTIQRFGLCLTLCAYSSFSQAHDLINLYQEAKQNDHAFISAIESSKSTRESKNIARAGLLPQIQGRANYSDAESELSGNIVGGGTFSVPDDTIGLNLSLSFSQALFDISAWHTYQASKEATALGDAEIKTAQQSLVMRVASAYFNVLGASDTLDTVRAQEDALKHQFDQSQQRFEVGLGTITDVHNARASYDSAIADRLDAEGNLDVAFAGLEALTGQSYPYISSLKDNFKADTPLPNSTQAWIDRAIANNPNIATASANSKASKHTAKSARADHFPTLSLQGSISDNTTDGERRVDGFDITNPSTENQSISLVLNVPIFSGGSTSASRRQAYYNAEASRQTYLQTKRDITQQVISNFTSVRTNAQTVNALKQAIISNESALESTQRGYQVGSLTLADVLLAQRNLFQARRNYFNALYTYIINSLTLKQTAGILSETDLIQLNQFLDVKKVVKNRYAN